MDVFYTNTHYIIYNIIHTNTVVQNNNARKTLKIMYQRKTNKFKYKQYKHKYRIRILLTFRKLSFIYVHLYWVKN